MNYWLAEPANLAELHEPLLAFIADLSVTGARTASTNYGAHGWVAHHNSDLWRQSAPVGDYGHGDPVWALWALGGPWLCQHLFEHYAFGGDLVYLRERAYPRHEGRSSLLPRLAGRGRGGSPRDLAIDLARAQVRPPRRPTGGGEPGFEQ